MEGAYAVSTEEVLNHFGGVSEKYGLSDAQVIEARNKYGSNGEFAHAIVDVVLFVLLCRLSTIRGFGHSTL